VRDAGNIFDLDLEILMMADDPERTVEMVIACNTGTCRHEWHRHPAP
jgi:hypothetical protein